MRCDYPYCADAARYELWRPERTAPPYWAPMSMPMSMHACAAHVALVSHELGGIREAGVRLRRVS